LKVSVASEAAGRPCPYCRAGLEPGAQAEKCDACNTLHHEDCWDENGGCTTYGCANAPKRAGEERATPQGGNRWMSRPLVLAGLACLVLLLISASTFAIISVLSGDSPVADEESESSTPTVSSASEEPTVAEPKPEPSFDTSSGKAFVRSYYELLNKRKFADVWDVLSSAEQAEAGSYPEWRSGYERTSSTDVTELTTTGRMGDVESLSVSIAATADCSGEVYEQSFAGSWTVDLEKPEVVSASFEQIGGDALPDGC